jgi:pantetheine-phosphate adenylyltransferase
MERIAIFPGSFDPVTKGHESIVLRSLSLFDKIIVAIGVNAEKQSFFPPERRVAWLKELFAGYKTVEVMTYQGLTIDLCRKTGANFILRGLRSSPDFEFERGIGQINRAMNPDVETVFMLTAPEHAAISSSIVRDIIRNGGDPRLFIPERIQL